MIDQLEEEIKNLQESLKKTQDKIALKFKKLNALKIEKDKDNLKDPIWLLQNPTHPGHYEATKKFMKETYGGEFNGPHISGYIHDGNYNPIQSNVKFWLCDPDKESVKTNCTHFVENYLQALTPVTDIKSRWDNKFPEVKVVPFQFRSEDSGLDFLGYCKEDGLWYHYTLVYGSINTERVFNSWDAAFDFAYELVQED